jgi:hypothetical protein
MVKVFIVDYENIRSNSRFPSMSEQEVPDRYAAAV